MERRLRKLTLFLHGPQNTIYQAVPAKQCKLRCGYRVWWFVLDWLLCCALGVRRERAIVRLRHAQLFLAVDPAQLLGWQIQGETPQKTGFPPKYTNNTRCRAEVQALLLYLFTIPAQLGLLLIPSYVPVHVAWHCAAVGNCIGSGVGEMGVRI